MSRPVGSEFVIRVVGEPTHLESVHGNKIQVPGIAVESIVAGPGEEYPAAVRTQETGAGCSIPPSTYETWREISEGPSATYTW